MIVPCAELDTDHWATEEGTILRSVRQTTSSVTDTSAGITAIEFELNDWTVTGTFLHDPKPCMHHTHDSGVAV
jgi:hypothetical protein